MSTTKKERLLKWLKQDMETQRTWDEDFKTYGIRHYMNLTPYLGHLKSKEYRIHEENTQKHNFSCPFSWFGC